MKLIVGLGNPGLFYENTRHNLGSHTVKAIAKKHRVKFRLQRSLKMRLAKIEIMGEVCLLAVPNSFMNLSGGPIALTMKEKEIDIKDLLVVFDDMDLEPGIIIFRKKGSAGGHKGIDSIIRSLNTNEFNRLKLGIGNAPNKAYSHDYVLTCFPKRVSKIINSAVQQAVQACHTWIVSGIDNAMNEFN